VNRTAAGLTLAGIMLGTVAAAAPAQAAPAAGATQTVVADNTASRKYVVSTTGVRYAVPLGVKWERVGTTLPVTYRIVGTTGPNLGSSWAVVRLRTTQTGSSWATFGTAPQPGSSWA
jgi:hypothetical protein